MSMMHAEWIGRAAPDSVIGDTYSELSSANATECGLYLCVKRYESSVVDGTFVERVAATFHNDTAGIGLVNVGIGDAGTMYHINPPPSFTNTSNPLHYWANSSTAFGVQISMEKIWPGYVETMYDYEGDNTVRTLYPSSDMAAYLQSLSFDDVNKTFDNLATSMINQIRSVSSAFATGEERRDVTIVSVEWRWLALPATLLGLTLIFLVAAARSSDQSGAMLWKSRSLATFYHPLTSEGREKLSAATGPKHLEKIAEGLEVNWERTGKGWRLVSQ